MTRMPTKLGTHGGGARSHGQVAVIFALSIVLFVALSAVVVDVAYYWVNTLQVQRAADSAALAGAVYLPGDTTTAYAEAQKSATRNGYTAGGSVTVVPVQDTDDPRQLDVTITAKVSTFFARVVGITSWPVTRTAKGVYVLPVPMGSPLAYYGVGDFWTNQTNGTGVPSSAPSGTWSNRNNGWTTGSSYATSATNNQQQVYKTFNFAGVTSPQGVAVSFDAKVSGSGTCKVKAAVSWDGGSTWGNTPLTTANLTTTDTSYSLGGVGDDWGSNHATWASADFTNTNFQIQLTYVMGGSCGTLSVNTIAASAYTPVLSVTKDGATTLASQGGWGAIITRGGSQQNGDAFAPENNAGSPYSGSNALYDADGYNYAVQLPSGGVVKVFDPGFCAMGGNPSGAGNMGAGDHWIAGNTNPVSTYYTLWNTNGKLGLPSAWGSPVGTPTYTSGTLFEEQTASDTSNLGPATSNGSDSMTGCDANHNSWWTLPTGALAGGTYVLQVSTTDPTDSSINASTNAENMFAIEAVGGGSPAVYGNGRMAVYNNLQPGVSQQKFFLAKIDRTTGAGKTALIDIFDPGDVPGNAVLKVFTPDGTGATQRQASFTYTTDANCNKTAIANGWSASDACASSGSVTQITTAVGGHSSFNNTWIHISIAMASTYGSDPAGLWAPPSKPTDPGWWQIQYETPGGGNDTTTWQVSVSGNPVHLLVP